MTEMFRSGFACMLTSLVVFSLPAGAAQPPRYVPAPAGKPYFLFQVGNVGFSEFTSSETTRVATQGGFESTMESTWKSNVGELGATVGYSAGPIWFVPTVDFSLYLPLAFRSHEFIGYLWRGDDPKFAQETLHDSLREGEPGMGLGDVEFGAQGLFYANHGGGTFISGGLRFMFATGASSHERFIRMLHGAPDKAGTGAGVTRVVPGVSVVKMVARQRVYAHVEYAVPLGAETFSFESPADDRRVYLDEGVAFEEEVKIGGTLNTVLGLQTSLDLWGISPGIELGIRSIGQAEWTENGRDGTEYDPGAADIYPTHTPEFLRTAAWSAGGLALKSNTEIEIGFVGAVRMRKRSEMLKLGISYISNAFGSAVGFRVAYMSMLVARDPSEIPEKEGVRAEEVEVAPMLAAPAAPTGSVKVGIAFPAFTAGVSAEEAGWVAAVLRSELESRPGYDVLPVKGMAHLASAPCGDANCGASFGRALAQQGMVVSRLEKIGDPTVPGATGFALTVQMIGVSDGNITSTETASTVRLDDMRHQLKGIVERMTRKTSAAGGR